MRNELWLTVTGLALLRKMYNPPSKHSAGRVGEKDNTKERRRASNRRGRKSRRLNIRRGK